MHKEFIEDKGNILVIDEDGSTKSYENTYRVRELLKTENIISKLEEKKEEINDDLDDAKILKKTKKDVILRTIFILGATNLIIFLTFMMNKYFPRSPYDFFIDIENYNIHFDISNFLKNCLSLEIIGISIAGIEMGISIKNNSTFKKEQNACEVSLELLEKELSKQKEKRDILKKNIEYERVENTKIDVENTYEKIDDNIDLYYDLEFNKEEYLKYLKRGIFEFMTRDYLTEEEQQKIKTTLEQKVLVKEINRN